MDILCVIPARSGSKGIKDKNITLVAGKPLIAYTIEAAVKAGYRVVVSTDSDKYAEISRLYGAEVVIRPPKLAEDNVHSIYAVLHCLDYLEETEGYKPDVVVTMLPTCPLRTHRHIREAVELHTQSGRCVVSVTEAKPPHYIRKIEKGEIKPLFDLPTNYQRQDLGDYYKLNGAIYVASPEYLRKHKTFQYKPIPYIMGKKYSVDIDIPLDIDIAEGIINKNSARDILNGLETYCDTVTLLSKQFRRGVFNRADIIVRYMALEELYGRGKGGVELYRRMQERRSHYHREHTYDPVQQEEALFKDLSGDIEQNGYCPGSRIIIDQDMHLIDGSHRLACCLFFNIPKIPIKVEFTGKPVHYSLEWFRDNGFSDKELAAIEEKRQEIFGNKGLCFTVVLWPPLQDHFNEITRELPVLSYGDYEFCREEFEAVVRGIYAVDDVKDWQIAKKLRFMQLYKPRIRVAEIEIKDPQFRTKNSGKLISAEVERLKQGLRNKYKDRIPNYFHDISLHIGDNYEHTRHIKQLLAYDIDINAFINSMNDCNYAFTKIEVPYLTDFPRKHCIGKDLDVLCGDFLEVCARAKKFAMEYSDKYIIRTLYKDGHYLIRFELESAPGKDNFLCFQLDISSGDVSRRVWKDGYYILEEEAETRVRLKEYASNPFKQHHMDYLFKEAVR